MKGVTNPYQTTEAVETSLSYLASLHDRNETPFFLGWQTPLDSRRILGEEERRIGKRDGP